MWTGVALPSLRPRGGSVRFRANGVNTVFPSIHYPPFLLVMPGVEVVTFSLRKPVWREI
jgi:hypothetical protein